MPLLASRLSLGGLVAEEDATTPWRNEPIRAMSAYGQNRRYEIRLANDRFLIRKRTFSATASNDDT
jgi:hypothetical protein